MDERGRAILSERPSARRQIAFTDVFCQITEQLGHLTVMSAPIATSSFGIRKPDVVWMPPERWGSFDRDNPVPFVPDL